MQRDSRAVSSGVLAVCSDVGAQHLGGFGCSACEARCQQIPAFKKLTDTPCESEDLDCWCSGKRNQSYARTPGIPACGMARQRASVSLRTAGLSPARIGFVST